MHLVSRRRASGFSLIELMVVISVIGILLALGVPTFAKWITDSRVRGAAENLTSGLRLAQASAIAHNRVTVFGLTSAAPSITATPSASGTNWFIDLLAMAGSGGSDATSTVGLLQTSGVAGQYAVSVASSSGSGLVCFNSMGQQVALTAAQTSLSVDCAPLPTTASPMSLTVSKSGATRSYKVLLYPAGQIRMCDAAKSLSNTNPDGCP